MSEYEETALQERLSFLSDKVAFIIEDAANDDFRLALLNVAWQAEYYHQKTGGLLTGKMLAEALDRLREGLLGDQRETNDANP